MVIGGFRLVSITLKLNQISAALQIQLGYVYLVLPLSGLLIMFYAFLSFMEKLHTAAEKSPGYQASAAKGG
jgi:TRAP-type C4-dicarboxylate transport system permease small subunit